MNQQTADDVIEVEVKKSSHNALSYSIEDIPPWYTSAFLGFQVIFCYTCEKY